MPSQINNLMYNVWSYVGESLQFVPKTSQSRQVHWALMCWCPVTIIVFQCFNLAFHSSTCQKLEMMDERTDWYGQCHARVTVGRWIQCQIKISFAERSKTRFTACNVCDEYLTFFNCRLFPTANLKGKYGASHYLCTQFLRDCKCYRFWIFFGSYCARFLGGQAKSCLTL